MSSSANTRSSFWLTAAVTFTFAGLVGWLAIGPVGDYVQSQAASYAADAAHQASDAVALRELQTASALDPSNADFRQRLADRYIARGNYDLALGALGGTVGERTRQAALLLRLWRAGEAAKALNGVSGHDVALERSKAYLEQGRGEDAVAAVKNDSDDGVIVQLALAQAVLGNTKPIGQLELAASDLPTTQRLRRIEGGGVSLAQELYQSGMPQSALRILAKTPESSASALLTAHIWLDKQPLTRDDLLAAQAATSAGLKHDVSSLQLHQLLQSIDAQLGDQGAANHEQDLINQLQSGKV